MPKASPQQYSMNGGEISPLLHGRQDLDVYPTALDTCSNFIPLVQGGLTRRPGTVFQKTVKTGGSRKVQLLPFEYSVDQAYVLEFGHTYVRFFTEDGPVLDTAQNIEAVTRADPGVITITGHGYSNGNRLFIQSIGGMTQLESQEVIVANAAADTFEIQDVYGNDIDTSAYGAFTSGGTVALIVEVTTTYEEADLAALWVTQSADTLYIFHPDFTPAKLIRTTATSWTLSDCDFLDGPYFDLNTTATTLTLSATSGSVTVTASAVTGINSDTGFQTTDIGRLIRFWDGTDWNWLEITARTSTTVVTATVRGHTAHGTTATVNWRLGLYSDTTGFPRTATFHDGRLFVGGAALALQRLDGSRTSDFENFAPTDDDGTVVADHAVSFVLSSGRVNTLQWMSSQETGLLIGTAGSEWRVRASRSDEAITPTSISAREITSLGSAAITPVRVSDVVLFLQRGERKLRELTYVFEADGFRSPDMTMLAEHLTTGGITQLALQQQPQPIVWAVRADGTLLGFTYAREQNVTGWHPHVLGGVGTSTDGQAVVESVAVIPSSEASRGDTVFLAVKRYINGRTERYIETLSKVWEYGDDQEDAVYLDSSTTTVSVSGTTSVTGLWHLEGRTVGVWVDGADHPDRTVANGTITLDSTYNVITVGEKFTSRAVTLPIEAGAADGSAQGKTKRIHRVGFILMDTLGLKYGREGASLDELLFGTWGQDWGVAVPVFTGVIRARFEGDYDRLGQVEVRSDTAAPATILSLTYQLDTQDDS